MTTIVQSITHTDYSINIKFNNGHHISCRISEYGQCCEIFGLYVMSNKKNVSDELDNFVYKELIDIDLVYNLYHTHNIYEEEGDGVIETFAKKTINVRDKTVSLVHDRFKNPVVRLTFKDEPYPLDIVLYNQHNGCYPHDCWIVINLMMNGYTMSEKISYQI